MFSTETFKFPIHFLILIPLVFGLSAYSDSGDGTPTTVHDGTGTGNGDTGSDGSTAPTSFDNMVVLYIRPHGDQQFELLAYLRHYAGK